MRYGPGWARFRPALIGVAFVCWGGVASAQTAPPNVAPPTREEVTPPPAPLPRARTQLQVEGDIERSACPLADPSYAAIRLTITEAVFRNIAPVDPETLRPAYAEYIGTDQPVSVICEIRDRAATILRRDGYLAAIQVPTQKIEGGKVAFEVLFARVSAIRVRGEVGPAERLIAGYLERLTRDPVFNRQTAERYLLLARDLPGYDVRLALRPTGQAPGELLGDVTIIRTPVEVDANLQNYASRDTGRFGAQLRGQIYGLTGLGDRTSIALYSTLQTREQQILQLGHDFRVGPEGLTFAGNFTYAWTQPDIAIAGKLTARTLFANAAVSYPFLRGERASVRGTAGFDFVNQKVRFVGTPLSRDRLRVGYVRIDGDVSQPARGARPAWRLTYTAELRQGVDLWDASDGGTLPVGPSRSDGNAEGTLVRAAANLSADVADGLGVSFAPRVQYAFTPLLSFEEYSAGNYTIGRGYDPGTIIGDSGAGFTAEVRINRLQPLPRASLAVQPFLFVDSAWVWNKNTPGDPQNLVSVGGGVRATFADRFRLDLTGAVPTKRAGFQARRGDARLLLSLTTKLIPWRLR